MVGTGATTGAGDATGTGDTSGGAAGTTGSATGGAGGAPTLIGSIAFSPPSQTFQGELWVTMTPSFGTFDIRYTTDGKAPSAASTLYDGTPLRVAATTQIRAAAFVEAPMRGWRARGSTSPAHSTCPWTCPSS